MSEPAADGLGLLDTDEGSTMDRYEFDAHGVIAGHPTFQDQLTEQLRNTPWLLISLAVHGVLAMILGLFSTTAPVRNEVPAIQVAAPEVYEKPLERLPEVDQPTREVDSPEKVTEQPVIKDTEIAEHNETDNDELTDESRGETEADSDKPFDAPHSGDTMGLGGGAGSAFGGPRGGNENLRTPNGGGIPRERVELALDWLSRHQSPDGSWDSDAYSGQCKHALGERCEGRGSAMYDVGVTGLALLAFLGAGHTHRDGSHRQCVGAGLKWLKSQQDAEGCFGARGDPHFSYNHAIAALAMAEAYGMTKSGVWRGPAQQGIDFVMQMQNPYKAWRYGVRPGDNDCSVTGWMVMALKSAKMAGLDMNDTALVWAHDFVKEMTDESTGRTGYMQRGEKPVRASGRQAQFPAEESESMTAVGMLVRIFAGEDPRTSSAIKAGAELCSRKLPVWEEKTGKIDMYYWYYATLSMFQVGGPAWSAWDDKMKSAIINTQVMEGCRRGSWDPVDPWGEDGGRVYSTAVMTMCLEVYYRYFRAFGTR